MIVILAELGTDLVVIERARSMDFYRGREADSKRASTIFGVRLFARDSDRISPKSETDSAYYDVSDQINLK